jgi:hypothetical protein
MLSAESQCKAVLILMITGVHAAQSQSRKFHVKDHRRGSGTTDWSKQSEVYPGIVPFSQSHDKLFKARNDLSQEDRCVRGTLVTGLTIRDIRLLDFFEGTVRERPE